MYRKEVNEQSPLRILDRSIHGGLGPGNLGVVMARAGVGKTAFLVQVGLDDSLRERDVLHVGLGQTLEHLQGWYDALFDDLAERTGLEDREAVRALGWRHRIIKAFADKKLTPDRLEKAVAVFEKGMGFQPKALLVDGWEWDGSAATVGAALGAFKALAKRLGAELWISARTHRRETGKHPVRVPPPCDAYAELIDVVVFLEPEADHVGVRLLKDHGAQVPDAPQLRLDCDTMRLVAEGGESPARRRLPAAAYTLLSGAAAGAEAEFGACAERFGLAEENFTFAGRGVERSRGLVQLDEAALNEGDVSMAYVEAHMHRSFPRTPLFKKILQSIWHQVHSAGEVFAVGVILPDQTVKGGTGWAVELARHWGKPVHVFDQERRGWYAWRDGAWAEAKDPVVTRRRFAGTGTRFLSDDGRAAILGLFERSFAR